MINNTRLGGGGDKAIPQMIENASLLGIDLIELLWTPITKQKRFSIAQIIGFKIPVMGDVDITNDVVEASGWIDSTLKFYPDTNGNCWGYCYDTPENREILYRSFANSRFRIVDKKIRDEIYNEAVKRSFTVEPPVRTEVMVKVSTREKKSEEYAKTLEMELREMKIKLDQKQYDLDVAQGKKLAKAEHRLLGVKIPNKEEALDNLAKMKETK